MRPLRLDPRGDVGDVTEVPDLKGRSDGESIGGFQELLAADKAGRLPDLLTA